MSGYEIIILALSCLFAGYVIGKLNAKGEEDERSSRDDDGQRND